jgi:two-component system LytT family response regulator
MKHLRCLVVDDEPLAADIVVSFLQQLGISSIGRCSDGIDAFRQLQTQDFDLLFLDIEMPQLTGFDLLKSLPRRPLVIITTAYRDYAVEGFEWEVLDYLVKPFSFARFLRTMEKATRAMANPIIGRVSAPIIGLVSAPIIAQVSSLSGQPPDEKGSLFIKTDRQWLRLDISGILYIESLKDYVRVVTSTGEYIVHQPLTDITARLPREKFFRVHRSFTLSVDKVDRIIKHNAHIGAKAIPISRANREEAYRRLGR